VAMILCQGKMAQPRMLTDMPICVLACTIILLCPPPAELCQWWQGEPGSAGGGSMAGRVCGVGWLCLLLFLLPLFAQGTFRWLVHAPCHMMLAPMVSVLAHLLALLVSGLGRDLLPCLFLLLLGLVSSVLLVLRLPIATLSLFFALAFALDNISKLVIKLEMSLESIERS
jgi:hypothetical protein